MFLYKYQKQEKRWLLIVLSSIYRISYIDVVIENIVYLVKKNHPISKNIISNRGIRLVHSREKLVRMYISMVVFGLTYRDMPNSVPSLNLS